MKTIALCLNIPEYEAGDFLNPECAKKYPGSGFVPHFVRLAKEAGYAVHSGRAADPGPNTLVIQEELNFDAESLIHKGSKPQVLICLESPIFASRFYDQMPRLKEKFAHTMTFPDVHFPSFDETEIMSPKPWDGRKLMCSVVAFKHYSMLGDVKSPAFEQAMKTQLHDERLGTLQVLYHKPDFTLYGKGWHDFAPECADKVNTISNFKFTLCYENGRQLGYVTEKIIDCLVAGTIPVYLGAPDILSYVPDACFIDASHFNSVSDMYNFCQDIPPYLAHEMIEAGQNFLRSIQGRQFSYQNFAAQLFERVCS